MEDINIVAPNVESLRRYIFKEIEELGKLFLIESNTPVLEIKRECGCFFTYKKELDIPSQDVTCKHNNKIIHYTDNQIHEKLKNNS